MRTISIIAILSAAVIGLTLTQPKEFRITREWLRARGEAPYYLDRDGATYVLDTDVVANGAAFVLKGDRVILDPNGHAVTYQVGATDQHSSGGEWFLGLVPTGR